MQHRGGPKTMILRVGVARLAISCLQRLRGCRGPSGRQLRTFLSGNRGILAASAFGLLSRNHRSGRHPSDRSVNVHQHVWGNSGCDMGDLCTQRHDMHQDGICEPAVSLSLVIAGRQRKLLGEGVNSGTPRDEAPMCSWPSTSLSLLPSSCPRTGSFCGEQRCAPTPQKLCMPPSWGTLHMDG